MTINTPDNIINKFEKELYAIRSDNIYKLLLDLREYPETTSVFPFGQFVHYTDKKGIVQETEILKYLQDNDHQNIEINKIDANIEDCFMDLMTGNN